MIMVVTGVGSLIHLYSIGYMHGEEGFYRYFSYLNLFVFAMLMLVLGSNALVMFIGWEGVGLCSYLLIGYYFHKKSAGDAAKKAFVVNRVGDFGFLLGLFTLFYALGSKGVWTINFVEIQENAHLLGNGSLVVTAVTLLFFLGATGKSAQIPLYTWLPDAMEGPTPVSALIHAATMVTAGVYMIGRMNGLFAMAPDTMMVIAIIGAATAIFAASIGFAQNDIKRVLAYSTVSQLGYMFLAMGVGAFTAGVFHLMTHAFFKACLFLGSGSVIHAMHHGLHQPTCTTTRRTCATWAACAKRCRSPTGPSSFRPWRFPVSRSSPRFFSKDEILWWSFASTRGSIGLWIVGALAAGMTAFYMFRCVSMTFWGEQRTNPKAKDHIHESPLVITFPLMVLGLLAVVGGYIGIPALFVKGWNHFEHFLDPVFGESQETYHIAIREALAHNHGAEWGLMAVSVALAFAGIAVAVTMYKGKAEAPARFTAAFPRLHRAVYNKWYVDELYDFLFVNPTKRLGTFLWKGFDVKVVDGIVNGVARLIGAISRGLRGIQTGKVHNYAMSMVVGVVLIVGFFILK